MTTELSEEERALLTVTLGDYKNPARISFAKIFTPEKNDLSGKDEYSAMFLFPKTDTDTIDKLKTAINTAIKGKWAGKCPPGARIPLRDGDKNGPTGVPASTQAGAAPYGGHYFINAKNSQKVDILDQKRNPILDPGALVSGDYVLASFDCYAYDNKTKGVSFGLKGVQLVRKGEPLGNSFDGTKVFGDVPMAEDISLMDSDEMFKV